MANELTSKPIRVPLTTDQVDTAPLGYVDLTEQQALSVRGKITAASGAGRKRGRKQPRCPCGVMTLHRAAARGHKCSDT